MRPSITAAASAPRAVGRGARARHRSVPGIVLEHAVEHRPLAARVAADHVEPATHGDGRGVMERHGQRGAALPAVAPRVVGLDLVAALAEAADHVEPARRAPLRRPRCGSTGAAPRASRRPGALTRARDVASTGLTRRASAPSHRVRPSSPIPGAGHP